MGRMWDLVKLKMVPTEDVILQAWEKHLDRLVT